MTEVRVEGLADMANTAERSMVTDGHLRFTISLDGVREITAPST